MTLQTWVLAEVVIHHLVTLLNGKIIRCAKELLVERHIAEGSVCQIAFLHCPVKEHVKPLDAADNAISGNGTNPLLILDVELVEELAVGITVLMLMLHVVGIILHLFLVKEFKGETEVRIAVVVPQPLLITLESMKDRGLRLPMPVIEVRLLQIHLEVVYQPQFFAVAMLISREGGFILGLGLCHFQGAVFQCGCKPFGIHAFLVFCLYHVQYLLN